MSLFFFFNFEEQKADAAGVNQKSNDTLQKKVNGFCEAKIHSKLV